MTLRQSCVLSIVLLWVKWHNMPIQFPRPTGSVRTIIESQWLRASTKCFDAVPAQNMGRPGMPFSQTSQNGKAVWSLAPGSGVQPFRAVNVGQPSTMYSAPDQTAKVNPASMIGELYNETVGFDRNLGQQNHRVVGVSRDASGAPLGGCTIKIFSTADDVLVATALSDGSGDWTAYPNQQGPYYFVEYKVGAPDVFGTSPNTNISTQFIPGG